MLSGLKRNVLEVAHEIRCWTGGHYAPFVTGVSPEWSFDDATIFTFHGVEPVEFESEMRFLADNGYRTMDAGTLISFTKGEQAFSDRRVLLTFDDGFESVWTIGAPILRRHGFRAMFFIVPAWVGTPGFVTWDQVKAAHDSGLFDIQSHTMTHRRMVPDSDADLPLIERELVESKRVIESHLPGHVVEHLCYPRGEGSAATEALSKKTGYRTNFWSQRMDRSLNRRGDDLYQLIRLKHDFIFRLPGPGRKSVPSLILHKALRRFRGNPYA